MKSIDSLQNQPKITKEVPARPVVVDFPRWLKEKDIRPYGELERGADPNAREVFGIRVVNDELKSDGLFPGDYAVFRKVVGLGEIEQGNICAVQSPGGLLLLKHVHLRGQSVRFSSSSPDYEDLVFPLERIRIIGVLIRMERDLL